MVISGGYPVQAFPVTASTYISPDTGMTAFNPEGFEILHCYADGDITFRFRDANVTVPAKAGMDYAIDPTCLSIDANCKVGIS